MRETQDVDNGPHSNELGVQIDVVWQGHRAQVLVQCGFPERRKWRELEVKWKARA